MKIGTTSVMLTSVFPKPGSKQVLDKYLLTKYTEPWVPR